VQTKESDAIYLLKKVCDDPRFEGFALKNLGELPDSVPRSCRTSRKWRVHCFKGWWKPIKVIGGVRPFNDNPGCMGHPVFSRRAVDALRDFLEPNGEILPLDSKVGEYFLYNVKTVADVLDWRRSEIVWDRRPIWAADIRVYRFHARKLGKLSIFRIPEKGHDVYVTEAFVQRVRENNLNGFRFDKVWPLPAGVWWKMAAKKPNEPSGKPIKGNMVHLDFRFANGAGKPSREESGKLNALMKQFDDALAENDPATVPTGHLEGSRIKPGKLCLVFSCPDAVALAKKLDPMLKEFNWKPGWTLKKSRKSFFTFSEFWGD
jgi:hypothetical protein